MFYKYYFGFIFLIALSAYAEEDFKEKLRGLGLKPETVALLEKNELMVRNDLCTINPSELNGLGIASEDTTLVEKLCSPVWLHPLMEEQCLSAGYDKAGIDWTPIHQEIIVALLWGRKTNHPAFLAFKIQIEKMTEILPQITVENILIQTLLGDYQLSLQNGDIPMQLIPSDLKECRRVDKTIKNIVDMEFVQIPAGVFTMGTNCPKTIDNSDCYQDELIERNPFIHDLLISQKPAHEVAISESFYLSKYEVTQAQWSAVMKQNPAYFGGKTLGDTSNYPVEQVSWVQVQTFIQRLNDMDKTKLHRLPTEAEWEYAARGGTKTEFFFGSDSRLLSDYAWFDKNADEKTHSVGLKQPNAYGLYDMLGNVWEWTCSDFAPYSEKQAQKCSTELNNPKVWRGGSWDFGEDLCRVAFRGYDSPEIRLNNHGFRLVMILQTDTKTSP